MGKLSHKNAIKIAWGVIFGEEKNGGGFWPFWAGKRAVSDSKLLVTLTLLDIHHFSIFISDTLR